MEEGSLKSHRSLSQDSIQELLKGECSEYNPDDSMREVWAVLGHNEKGDKGTYH